MFTASSLLAQNGRELWTQTQPREGVVSRQAAWVEAEGASYALDETGMAALLQSAPMEFSRDATQNPFHMQLPLPDGSFAEFAIVEAPVMHPGLAAKFPDIRTFRGNGVDVPAATARLDITPKGFHAQILSPAGAVYIDPQVRNRDSYVSYYHRNAPRRDHRCLLEDAFSAPKKPSRRAQRSGSVLRTYRLAVAAQGEYTQFHGGTVADGLAAICTTINRVTGIYETELSVRLELVLHNDLLIYTDPATDPYPNNSDDSINQVQADIDAKIGSANYDVGHVVNTSGGGLAGLGVVCRSGHKAEGVTGSSQPKGDAFDVDFVAHELGHQFGANHTFNSSSGSCGSGNRNGPTAYEPGSGVTIMGYAGLCGADDLASNSIPYFHSASLDEIQAYLSGQSCEIGLSIGNTAPVVSAGNPATIPARTPFTLIAAGGDPDGQSITYSWEQRDLGPAASLASGDNGTNPLFRPWPPRSSPIRTFPRVNDLLAGTTVAGETLPTTSRSLNFRVTARDNQAGGGGVSSSDVAITVIDTGSAFAITSPATNVTWSGTETVTWDVAGTTGNGIGAANVNILLSTDGGLTFPISLASGIANSGQANVRFPAISTTQARLRIEPTQNIFFAISPGDFTIVPSDVWGMEGVSRVVATKSKMLNEQGASERGPLHRYRFSSWLEPLRCASLSTGLSRRPLPIHPAHRRFRHLPRRHLPGRHQPRRRPSLLGFHNPPLSASPSRYASNWPSPLARLESFRPRQPHHKHPARLYQVALVV